MSKKNIIKNLTNKIEEVIETAPLDLTNGIQLLIGGYNTSQRDMIEPRKFMDSKLVSYSSKAFGVLNNAFSLCTSLTTINLPVASYIGPGAFEECYKLLNTNFPNVKFIGATAFSRCMELSTVYFPKLSFIDSHAFYSCHFLMSVYLLSNSVCKISDEFAFAETPISNYTYSTGQHGSIFVPAGLISAYKADPIWSYYSDRIVPYIQ